MRADPTATTQRAVRAPRLRPPRLVCTAAMSERDTAILSVVVEDVEYPGLVWVKDPVDLKTGQPNGDPPRKRHQEDCTHWYRDAADELLGPPAYRATYEQMRTLPPCSTCAKTNPGGSTDPGAQGTRRGRVCPTCFVEMPVSGQCATCR